MKIRRLDIENFRGIRSLSWVVPSDFVGLVGPGDSTKTTVLDALGAALSSRFNLAFSDSDFYAADPSRPITITVAVSDLPDKLVREQSQGKNRAGIRTDGTLEREPLSDPDVDDCLLIRLRVGSDLEPIWSVIRGLDDDEGERITANERAALGFFRVGEYANSHLRWGRGSALTGLTEADSGAGQALVEAQRKARAAVAGLSGTSLHAAADRVKDAASRLGGGPYTDLRPGLDGWSNTGGGSLVLHEGAIPLTSFGLGSRRLTSFAVQDLAVPDRSVLAVDEIEHGLEPHRLLHLMRHLQAQAQKGGLQVFLTTHSPIVVEGLDVSHLAVVRSTDGATTIKAVPDELAADARLDMVQGLMRSRPSALLGRRVVVGEGATETGFLRRLLWGWDATRSPDEALTAITAGVVVANGGGDGDAPKRAEALQRLGYPTMLVVDGDVATNAGALTSARNAGVTVLRWPEGAALEDVIASAVTLEGLQKVVALAIDELGPESVLASIASRLSVPRLPSSRLDDWVETFGESKVRAAVASAAKGAKTDNSKKEERKAWFKREDRAERLGALISELQPGDETQLGQGLAQVREFAYATAGRTASRGES